MRFVVGYTADRGGRVALDTAVALAASVGADAEAVELDIVMVVPQQSPVTASQPGADPAGYEQILDATLRQWADDALAQVPDAVTARVLVRAAESESEGLLAACEETGADMIVVSPRTRALGRSLGSVASALLHSSPVPVLLAAPLHDDAWRGPARITAFLGTREGAEAVAANAAALAQRRHVPLRIVSLVALEVQDGADERLAAVREVIEDIAGRTTLSSEVLVLPGESIDEAIATVAWQRDDLALLGSSRLGGHRLFLGSTAYKVVRDAPVPVVVVPRHATPPTPARSTS